MYLDKKKSNQLVRMQIQKRVEKRTVCYCSRQQERYAHVHAGDRVFVKQKRINNLIDPKNCARYTSRLKAKYV